jgi:hypothetical protein
MRTSTMSAAERVVADREPAITRRPAASASSAPLDGQLDLEPGQRA